MGKSKDNKPSQEKPCNHFMVWNIQGGYSYYRCDNCRYIDGEKTFGELLAKEKAKEWDKYILISVHKAALKAERKRAIGVVEEKIDSINQADGFDKSFDINEKITIQQARKETIEILGQVIKKLNEKD